MTFFQCLKKEYMKRAMEFLTCIPPWMTSKKDQWCNNLINTTSENKRKISNRLDTVMKGKASRGECLPICKSVWYKTTKNGHDEREDRYGLYVEFRQKVILTSNHLSIEPMTLLTRIGGIIGVGKEFFWVIISVSSLLFMMRKHTRSWIWVYFTQKVFPKCWYNYKEKF